MTSSSLPDSLIEAMVSAAVADEVQRSASTVNRLDTAQLAALGAELLQLRTMVANQAATVTSLRQQLGQVEQASRLMPIEQLVAGLVSAVATGAAGMPGHMLSQVGLNLRTALTAADDGDLVAGEPTLSEPHLLSTISVTLRSVPPRLSQAAADDTGMLRTAAEAAQAALERVLSHPAAASPAGVLMASLARIIQHPQETNSWAQIAPAALGTARALSAVAGPARRLADAAAAMTEAGTEPPASALSTAATALTAFAGAVMAAED